MYICSVYYMFRYKVAERAKTHTPIRLVCYMVRYKVAEERRAKILAQYKQLEVGAKALSERLTSTVKAKVT